MTGTKNYTNLKENRYERKFVLRNSDLTYAKSIIKQNPANFKPIYFERTINNIYFDTHNLQNYYDNNYGKNKRIKVRIRWYGNTFGEIKNPILEFKIKIGLIGKKISFQLVDFHIGTKLYKDYIKSIIKNSNLPEWVNEEVFSLEPTLLNTYSRQYFLSFDKKYRFTIDRNIKYYNPKSNNIKITENKEQNIIVLELKYNTKYSKDAHIVSNYIPVRLEKFSKYANGIELFYNGFYFTTKRDVIP